MLGTAAFGQSLLQTFGSGANSFSIDFVEIGNPGNAADTTGYGSVAYTYKLGKYEVSRDMVTKANAEGGLGITLADMSTYGGNGVNRPATGISWIEAARFVNWLNTSTGGQAAYKFDGSGNFQFWNSGDPGYQASNLLRNSLAKYWLPNTDEFYKGAYGSPAGAWYSFATGSNSVPTPVAAGNTDGTAVYDQGMGGPADITNAGGLSAYGTMAQGGNALEWSETMGDGNNANTPASDFRSYLGDAWWADSTGIAAASTRDSASGMYALADFPMNGFRVAGVPEPSSLSLLALGGVVVAFGRRKRAAPRSGRGLNPLKTL